MLGEQILLELCKEPNSFLSEDFDDTILSLQQPLSFISEDQRLEARKAALVAKDGLSAAVEELVYTSDRPFSVRRIRILRVATAVISRELSDGPGTQNVVNAVWNERSTSVVMQVAMILSAVDENLSTNFTLASTAEMNAPLVEELFHLACDLFGLIGKIAGFSPFTTRSLASIMKSVAGVHACARGVLQDMASSKLFRIAGITEQVALSLVSTLVGDVRQVNSSKATRAQVVLTSLLQLSLNFEDGDPALHIVYLLSLVERCLARLAEADTVHAMRSILPNILQDLVTFYRLLSADSKYALLLRIAALDNDSIGLRGYLLHEELKDTLDVLGPDVNQMDAYQLGQSIKLLGSLAGAPWFNEVVEPGSELAQNIATLLEGIFQHRYSSTDVPLLVEHLARRKDELDEPTLKFWTLLLVLTWHSQIPSVLPQDLLEGLIPNAIQSRLLQQALGWVLAAIASADDISDEDVTCCTYILQWLSAKEDVQYKILRGITSEQLSRIYTKCNYSAESQSHLSVDEDLVEPPQRIELPDQLDLPPDEISRLLNPPDIPSTPKRTNKTPDILGVVISPPTALLRSLDATGLTKTYSANDFRDLRQSPQARQNTSRLPSKHGEPQKII